VAKVVAEDQPLVLTETHPPIVGVPVQSWSQLASRGLRFALELSTDVRALHILTQDSTICELTAVWEDLVAGPAREAGLPPPQLILRKSTYRQFFAPLVALVEQLRDRHPDRDIVVTCLIWWFGAGTTPSSTTTGARCSMGCCACAGGHASSS